MLSSKQRALLRGFANDLPTILQIGKGGITETLCRQADEALLARELIKLRVLENAPVNAREAAEEIAGRVSAQVIQVIGTRAVLFRQNKESRFQL
ncbi:MAG: YhbY family RNA-binding protein [Provencibacterium sp.]|jgi:RNA-binding protein|nr:YhbY family RNA-binding protein [Provencibacterium sp.]